jgi:hypothetical protein
VIRETFAARDKREEWWSEGEHSKRMKQKREIVPQPDRLMTTLLSVTVFSFACACLA